MDKIKRVVPFEQAKHIVEEHLKIDHNKETLEIEDISFWPGLALGFIVGLFIALLFYLNF